MALLWKDLAYKKRVSQFTPKKFYEIDPRWLEGVKDFSQSDWVFNGSFTRRSNFTLSLQV